MGLWKGTAARLTSPRLGQPPSPGFRPTSWWLPQSLSAQLSQPDSARPAEPPLLPEHGQVHARRLVTPFPTEIWDEVWQRELTYAGGRRFQSFTEWQVQI